MIGKENWAATLFSIFYLVSGMRRKIGWPPDFSMSSKEWEGKCLILNLIQKVGRRIGQPFDSPFHLKNEKEDRVIIRCSF